MVYISQISKSIQRINVITEKNNTRINIMRDKKSSLQRPVKNERVPSVRKCCGYNLYIKHF